MSDIADFGAHARAMSTAEHRPDCTALVGRFPRWVHPDPACLGCVTDDERALWARLADEVDAYPHHDEAEGLFG